MKPQVKKTRAKKAAGKDESVAEKAGAKAAGSVLEMLGGSSCDGGFQLAPQADAESSSGDSEGYEEVEEEVRTEDEADAGGDVSDDDVGVLELRARSKELESGAWIGNLAKTLDSDGDESDREGMEEDSAEEEQEQEAGGEGSGAASDDDDGPASGGEESEDGAEDAPVAPDAEEPAEESGDEAAPEGKGTPPQFPPSFDVARSVYVGNLAWDLKVGAVVGGLTTCGKVTQCELPTNKKGLPTGCVVPQYARGTNPLPGPHSCLASPSQLRLCGVRERGRRGRGAGPQRRAQDQGARHHRGTAAAAREGQEQPRSRCVRAGPLETVGSSAFSPWLPRPSSARGRCGDGTRAGRVRGQPVLCVDRRRNFGYFQGE